MQRGVCGERTGARRYRRVTCEGTRALNRFTQIRNNTTLNTCNISRHVSAGNQHEKGCSRSDTIGLKGSCDAAKTHGQRSDLYVDKDAN